MKVERVFKMNAERMSLGHEPLSESLMSELLEAAHEADFAELLSLCRAKGFATPAEVTALCAHHSWTTRSLTQTTDEIKALLVSENLQVRPAF